MRRGSRIGRGSNRTRLKIHPVAFPPTQRLFSERGPLKFAQQGIHFLLDARNLLTMFQCGDFVEEAVPNLPIGRPTATYAPTSQCTDVTGLVKAAANVGANQNALLGYELRAWQDIPFCEIR
jgi:hypothetical protein